MKVFGIIAEWNPLHNGHVYLMEQARARGAQAIVAVMSGNFVQRGEPALFSKWARTQMALSCGADLIIELPLPWAISGAQGFAAGGVSLLHALGCVDTLLFGSECGKIPPLQAAAAAIDSPAVRKALSEQLNTGISFPAAREAAVRDVFGNDMGAVLREPNNILGIEYCRALHELHAPLLPQTVLRIGPSHDEKETQHRYASASLIRERLKLGGDCSAWLPPQALAVISEECRQQQALCRYEALETAVLAELRRMSPAAFAKLPDISEGLENRLWQAARTSTSLTQFLELVKTKRYSLARIRRIALSTFLGLQAEDAQGLPSYLRILGMNAVGRSLLHTAGQKAALPIVSQLRDIRRLSEHSRHIFSIECRATDLWTLGLPHPASCGMELTRKILYQDI